MTNLLITNARLVNEGETRDADVLIKGERIEQIGSGLSAADKDQVLDARGMFLLPGMIDDQVHFREPGLTNKGDLATESVAAVAGGVTSFMDMPNVNPQTTTREALANKYQLAAGRCRANYAFYLGATNRNIDEIKALQIGESCGIKAFMGASTGDMLVDDPQALELLFEHAPVIMSEHPNIRSANACLLSSSQAVNLARRHDSLLHVLHLTTAMEMGLFSKSHRNDKRITAEVCVHHLWFDESRYKDLGTRIKCNPAIKTAEDREALLKAVNEDRIDIIATDHAPHTVSEKGKSYFKAPAGLPLVQHVMLCLFDMAADGKLSYEKIVDKTSHAVADIFGVVDRGYVREGYFADLVLVDPDRPYPVTSANLLAKCHWSPFEGHTFSSSIDTTIVNGTIAYQDETVSDEIAGQRLDCNRSR
jgi:dihydroorotase